MEQIEIFQHDKLDELTDNQREQLETVLRVRLNNSITRSRVHDEAIDAKDKLIDELACYNDESEINDVLKDEIAECYYRRIDNWVTHGQLPETHKDAHDVVNEIVWKITENIYEDVKCSYMEVHRRRERQRNEPEPDIEYERQLGI